MTRLDAVVPGTPQLDALAKQHGTLGTRLIQLRKPQQEMIANAAYEEGFINAMNALEVSADHLGRAMHLAGYDQCSHCEEWFPRLELDTVEDAAMGVLLDFDSNQELLFCEECKTAQDIQESAVEPPEPTTPEEIAEAEAKKQRARDAVIAQEERKAQREEILSHIPEPETGTKPE